MDRKRLNWQDAGASSPLMLLESPESPKDPAAPGSPVPPPPMPRPLKPGGWMTESERRWFDDTARAARAGDREAIAAVWTVLQPRFDYWAGTICHANGGYRGPRVDGRPLLLDDLRQEGFPVLLGLLDSWRGETGFFLYVLRSGRFRMRDAWGGLWGRLRVEPLPEGADSRLADGSASVEDAVVMVAEIGPQMDETDRALMLACVAEGRSMAAAGRRVGLGRRETQRRFDRIRRALRESLRRT